MVGDEYERERWRGFNGSTSTDAVLAGGKETQLIVKYIKHGRRIGISFNIRVIPPHGFLSPRRALGLSTRRAVWLTRT